MVGLKELHDSQEAGEHTRSVTLEMMAGKVKENLETAAANTGDSR